MSIYAMEKALKALEQIYGGCGYIIEDKLHEDAMDLAGFVRKDCIEPIKVLSQAIQQQIDGEWVGLTDEEVYEECSQLGFAQLSPLAIAQAIEAKLRKKNT